jgi:hypothetical protein
MGYPENAAYAVAGYLITTVVLLAYTLSLSLRIRKERSRNR